MSEQRGVIDLWSGIGLVVASMVGTGVLVSNSFMIGALSPFQTGAVWVVQALMAIAGAIAYARISTMIPRSGGEYRYLSELFHPALGYLAGWTSLLVGFAAPVATNAATAGSLANELGLPIGPKATGAVLIGVITLFQVVDRQAAKWTQNVFVVIKAGLFLTLVGFGVFMGAHEITTDTDSTGPASVFAINLFFAAYAFSGWNASIYAAEEFSSPSRDVARSMIVGVIAVAILYLAVTYVFVLNLTPDDMAALGDNKERGIHLLVAKLMGPGAAVAATIGIILVLASSTNVMTLVGPRVNASMAQDGFLPRAFVAKPGRPPTLAIITQGCVAMALLMSHSLGGLIQNVGIMLVVMSGLTVLGLIRARFSAATRARCGGAVPSTLSVAAAAVYFCAAGWMFYYAIKMGSSGVLWVGGVTGIAMVAYGITVWLRRRVA